MITAPSIIVKTLTRLAARHVDPRPVTAGPGRIGPWLRHGRTHAAIPKDEDVLTIGLNRAVMLIGEKEAGGGRTGF